MEPCIRLKNRVSGIITHVTLNTINIVQHKGRGEAWGWLVNTSQKTRANTDRVLFNIIVCVIKSQDHFDTNIIKSDILRQAFYDLFLFLEVSFIPLPPRYPP